MLTDHAGHMTEAPFESLFLPDAAAGDEPVRERRRRWSAARCAATTRWPRASACC